VNGRDVTATHDTSGQPDGSGQPDERYFDVMAQQAATHWWYRARRALLYGVLERAGVRHGRILDAGCGTGDNFVVLDRFGDAVGTDLSGYALRRAPLGAAGGTRVAVATATHLPVVSGALDLLVSMDVIEHLDDDVLALEEYRRALRPGGQLLVTVPAYQFMWSHHDEWAAHRRRYRRRTVCAAVAAAGFEIVCSTYFFSFLVPPAFVLRRTPLRRLVRTTDDEVGAASPPVDRVMSWMASIERWAALRWRIPFGLSILVLARRPDELSAAC